MPLVQTRGAASAQGFGEFAQASGGAANYIEDVFSTYLYTGNGSTQTITNGIDLSGKGGLVWLKSRASGSYDHQFVDTTRGSNKYINSNNTNAETTNTNRLTTFNTDGFALGASAQVNEAPASGYAATYASWTFRKQPKFFDVVTYTGNGTAGRTVAHNLGSVPGCIIVKRTNSAAEWAVYHRSLGATKYLWLNDTTPEDISAGYWNDTTPTSSVFTVGDGGRTNGTGNTYVAYVFAHNAGGFGLTGTDNVISCGSFTSNSLGIGTVNLGYEPQWVMFKTSATDGDWQIFDNMRGMPARYQDFSQVLTANTSNAEQNSDRIGISATGFTTNTNANEANIYIAIRRGPMKVPTDATKVFSPVTVSQTDIQQTSSVSFPTDLVYGFSRNGTDRTYVNQFWDRLRGIGTPADTFSAGGLVLNSTTTAAETTSNSYLQLKADSRNITRGSGWNTALYGNFLYYFFQRAPSFFDEVCYTGTGTGGQTFNHNLGVVPELMIVKSRGIVKDWVVYAASEGANKFCNLNRNDIFYQEVGYWNNTAPTSSVFTLGTRTWVNDSGSTFVNYLFASCSGVSKVGSYIGDGSVGKTINCGFTGGARFVLIKRTDDVGDWYVWDSARGIVSGNDPHLSLNSTAAEVTTNDTIDADSSGFIVNQRSATNVNVSSATYIFLAIA